MQSTDTTTTTTTTTNNNNNNNNWCERLNIYFFIFGALARACCACACLSYPGFLNKHHQWTTDNVSLFSKAMCVCMSAKRKRKSMGKSPLRFTAISGQESDSSGGGDQISGYYI